MAQKKDKGKDKVAVTALVPPPAWQQRPGTIPTITLSDLGKSVLTTGAGALITAVFISSLQGGNRFFGGLISTGLGVIFVATSPIGTIPSELGIGMLSSSAGWFVFDTLGLMKKTF